MPLWRALLPITKKNTGEISIHVQDVKQGFALFAHISEDALVEKVRQIFFFTPCTIIPSANFAR